MKKVDFFRKKYPQFIYKNYSFKSIGGDFKIIFDFHLPPDIRFTPEIIIKNIEKEKINRVGEEISNLIFHLGLIEILSYWKVTSSPEIIIEAGFLNQKQIQWWKDLIFKGMGQFFYQNQINWRAKNFLKISSYPKADNHLRSLNLRLRERYLIPLREGKDSIVTLESLKKEKQSINVFVVNPTPAAGRVLKIARITEPIVVRRKIDPLLLKLNRQGYLNGHTPFTALLSFLSVLVATLFDYRHIAFSNEKGSEEGNLKYLGRIINHQYSKTREFEKKFQSYCRKYLAKNLHYFSFLRKYSALEIGKEFSQYSQYFPVFLSCNEAYKTNSGRKKPSQKWCRNCSKCLFVYTILYPFLEKKELLKIFGQDLFRNKKLLPIMKGLIGKKRVKPFECLGTYRESQIAFNLSLKKAEKLGKIPYLLEKFNEIRRIKK